MHDGEREREGGSCMVGKKIAMATWEMGREAYNDEGVGSSGVKGRKIGKRLGREVLLIRVGERKEN